MPTIIDSSRRTWVELCGQVRGGHVERAVNVSGCNGAAVRLGIAGRHHHRDLNTGTALRWMTLMQPQNHNLQECI